MRNLHKVVVKFSALFFILGTSAFAAEEYSFKVTNTTNATITQILVSEDGKAWNFFSIGKGIPAGETMELVWDASSDKEACKQYVKAIWNDNSEAEPAMFDFCEKNLEIEF